MHKAATGLQMLQKLTLTLTASAGKINAYVRLLFIKFSSAFHTTIPGGELRLLGLDTCKWILDFLIERQTIWVSSRISDTISVSKGSTQGCVVSLLFFTLLTHVCMASFTTLLSSCWWNYSCPNHLFQCTIESVITYCITSCLSGHLHDIQREKAGKACEKQQGRSLVTLTPTHSSNITHCSLCEYVSLLVLFCMPLFFCLCVSMYMCVFTFSPTWFLLSLSNSPVCNLLINSAAAHQRIKAGWAPTR